MRSSECCRPSAWFSIEEGREWNESEPSNRPSEQVRSMFKRFRSAPLPIALVDEREGWFGDEVEEALDSPVSIRRSSIDISEVIMFDTSLLAGALNNGNLLVDPLIFRRAYKSSHRRLRHVSRSSRQDCARPLRR